MDSYSYPLVQEQSWYDSPVTSYDEHYLCDTEIKTEDDYTLGTPYTFEGYDSPGPMKRPMRTSAGKTSKMYSPAPSEESDTGKKTKVGRPSKVGSHSKMADYARNYRAVKKEESRQLEERNNELMEENKSLITQNKALRMHLQNLEREMNSLRSVMNNDNQIAAIVASLGGGSPTTNPVEGGVCLHLAGGRVQLEICQTCNQRVRDRALACRQSRMDPLLGQAPSQGLEQYF